MVKRKNDMDEILERYLPRASDEEAGSARDRFLVFLQERRQLHEAIDNLVAAVPVEKGDFASLGYVDQLVLTATYLFRGEGTSTGIAEKVNELTPGKVIDAGAVFVALDGLERARLIAASPANRPMKGRKPALLFTVTSDGERMLLEIRAGARLLIEALEDFAART